MFDAGRIRIGYMLGSASMLVIGVALPISGVDGLGEGMEFVEGVRFADTGDLVLDVGQKSAIHLLAEGGVAPLDMGG